MLEYVFLREQLYFLLMNHQVDLLFVFLLSYGLQSLGDRTINIKNKYYKKFISTTHDFYFAKFKLYRNRLQFLIKLSKKSYYDDYFNKYSSDTKKLWSGIKQIITTK